MLSLVGLGVSLAAILGAVTAGGGDVDITEFPHLGLLGYNTPGGNIAFQCIGTLISRQVVLTSAHCLGAGGLPVKWVLLGTADRTKSQGLPSESSEQRVAVREFVYHPNQSYPSFYNDVGLLILGSAPKLGPQVQPACLPRLDGDLDLPDEVMATTWEWRGDLPSGALVKMNTTTVPQDKCREEFGKPVNGLLPYGVLDSQFCAVRSPTAHVCYDGLSILQTRARVSQPAAAEGPSCKYEVVGVGSIGSPCDKPALFSRVDRFVPWIDSVVARAEKETHT